MASFVSLGDKLDLSSNDLLQYWDQDPDTDVIALYLESFGNPAKFGRIAGGIPVRKPVVAVKSGHPAWTTQAGASHTATLVAAEGGVDALFRHAGVIRTDTLEASFDVAALLSRQPLPRGDRVAVIANARGPGVVCADACEASGLRVAALSEATRAVIREAVPRATLTDPVDLSAAASAQDVERTVVAV